MTNNVNFFQKLLREELSPLEKVYGTVKFQVKIPLSVYKSKGDLYKKYAERDIKGAEKVSIKKIENIIKPKKIPLNVNVKAFFNSQSTKETIFDVYVEGGDENFMIKLIGI